MFIYSYIQEWCILLNICIGWEVNIYQISKHPNIKYWLIVNWTRFWMFVGTDFITSNISFLIFKQFNQGLRVLLALYEAFGSISGFCWHFEEPTAYLDSPFGTNSKARIRKIATTPIILIKMTWSLLCRIMEPKSQNLFYIID